MKKTHINMILSNTALLHMIFLSYRHKFSIFPLPKDAKLKITNRELPPGWLSRTMYRTVCIWPHEPRGH